MRSIVLIAHNLRSCHNVGSLLRTAEGLGLSHVYLTGYTPYPHRAGDNRLPHISNKLHKQIQKTALGAELADFWTRISDISKVIAELSADGYTIAALEQTDKSIDLPTWQPPDKIAIIVGRETEGLEQAVIAECNLALEIPMAGKKESFNVVQAAAMCLYHCKFFKL